MERKQCSILDCHQQNWVVCDRCILNFLQPHLAQVEENSYEFSQIQQTLRLFKQALEKECVISLDINGHVEFMTQNAEQLLSHYFLTYTPPFLPNPLHHWFNRQISQLKLNDEVPYSCLPLHIEQKGQQLIIYLITDSIKNKYVLLLEEQPPQSFSINTLELLNLTQREAEVLFWIAKDKSNTEVAKVLGCSKETIRKHLENIYKKLGVQTRMGAVMVSLEKLGLLKN